MSGDRMEAEREAEESFNYHYYQDCVDKFIYLFEMWVQDKLESQQELWHLPHKMKVHHLNKWREENTLDSVGIDLNDEDRFFEDVLDYNLDEPPESPWEGNEPLDRGFESAPYSPR